MENYRLFFGVLIIYSIFFGVIGFLFAFSLEPFGTITTIGIICFIVVFIYLMSRIEGGGGWS